MPDTRLILHVKGTEAETAELPKEAVRAAISQGKITHSQLIWIPAENQWRQVRELPDLLPVERLILHVKGTESQTTELPKDDVRAAISQGKITHSQLIWIPAMNSWKPVSELPDLLPDDNLILHVKGTEAETRQVPRKAVRTALSQGDLTHSQLIWSAKENTWKQVRELPELLPSQKLAPAPVRTAPEPVAKVPEVIIPESPTGPVDRAVASVAKAQASTTPPSTLTGTPKVRVATASPSPTPQVRAATPAAATPKVKVAGASPTASQATPRVAKPSASTPQAAAARKPQVKAGPTPILVRTTGDIKVKEEHESHPLKWVCIGLSILILIVLGGNYFLVDQPLVSNLAETQYSNDIVYAHLGAFMQPNVMVIHIPHTTKITPANLTKFLVALAHSTPISPISRDLYTRVALTAGWTAQYSFSGYSWKQLGDMTQEDEPQRKEFLMDQMDDAGGQSLMPETTLSDDIRQSKREQVWTTFVNYFTTSPSQ